AAPLSSQVYGLLAEAPDEVALIALLKRVKEAGYTHIDAHSPYPVEELDELIPNRRTTLSWFMFCAVSFGALFGFGFQSWSSAVDYPILFAGTSLLPWPAFLPVTFEMGVLCGAITGLLSAFLLGGLPRYNHPVFSVPDFRRASSDLFYAVILSSDPIFDEPSTRAFLEQSGGQVRVA
ncbi:unnamed protein product, partial [Phaeothamnion confervicola]